MAKQITAAKVLASKLDRLAGLDKPYAFRLAAMLATDCRPGTWYA